MVCLAVIVIQKFSAAFIGIRLHPVDTQSDGPLIEEYTASMSAAAAITGDTLFWARSDSFAVVLPPVQTATPPGSPCQDTTTTSISAQTSPPQSATPLGNSFQDATSLLAQPSSHQSATPPDSSQHIATHFPVAPLSVQTVSLQTTTPALDTSPATTSISDNALAMFLAKGCGCKKACGRPCYTLFTKEHYQETRWQCAELTRNELDMVLMRQHTPTHTYTLCVHTVHVCPYSSHVCA